MKNHLQSSLLIILRSIALWLVSIRATYAQPLAPPSLFGGMLPDWIGAAGAALVVGGILFLILRAIGESLGDRLDRPFIEKLFYFLGVAAWVAVFITFMFVL